MRPLLPGELDTITAPAVAQHTRVEVQDAAGVWRDWSAYVSLDGTACGEDREQGVGSAVIALHRGLGASSLVPLVTTSGPNTVGGGYAPAVDIGRGVRISTATTAPGVTPTTEWREIFRGRVNGVAWESDPITLSCSDLGAWLMDAQIETASRYDFAGGAAREYVMQQVIDAAPLGVTPPTLVTPASPLSYLTKWDQPPAKLLDALRTLAGGIGWDVRYRYDASHTPQLTFYDPDRERVDTDATFPDTRYLAIQRLSVSLANVRNAGRVWYGDGAEDYVEGAVAPGVFRRRWFQIPKQEGIDTAEEAERLLAAALHDLSGADVELSVTLRHFWPVQLFDRYLIGANADTHDAGQVLAVSGYRHTWQNGVIYTTLTGASRVVGAYADWIRRGRGAPTTAEPEILELTFEDTTDGVGVTTRTYTIRANGATRTVWAYDRLRPPGSGDPWPSDAELPDGLPPVLTLDADGVTTYTTPVPPPGYQRFLQFEPRTAAGQEGEVRRATIDPAAPATSGSVSALVTNDTADLTVRVTGGPGSWPVAWFLYEDDPAGLPLASGTATADTSLTKLSPGLAVLGARPLPLREVRRWFLKLLDANGLTAWGASASADRDALPEGTVTPRDYRADAELAVAYDDDTDSVRVTVPGGKTKTWAGLSGSGTVVYAVGDPLDDATTEGALALDETREGYTVEIQGGGTWVPKFDGALHGPPSSPPTVRPRFVLSADRDAADVFVTVDSSADEAIRLWVRDSDSSSAPEYGLVAGAGSTVALYVTRGTELGPAHFFRASSGSAAAKFSGIPLVRDQVRTIYVQAEGEQSLVRSAWVPVPLGTKEQPYLESLEATWDAAAGELRVTARGGAHSASVMIEADDAAAFSSSLAPAYAALVDGGSAVATFSLSGAQRGRVWYVRARPYNGALSGGVPTGLPGAYQEAQADVPAVVTIDFEATENAAGSQGTLTAVVADPGALLDPANRVKFWLSQAGTRALYSPTTAPGGGATEGTYTFTFNLHADHVSVVEPWVYYADGSIEKPPSTTFDSDKFPNVLNAAPAYAANVATVTATFDSDTPTGGNYAEYRVDGGSWTAFAVSAGRTGSFNVTLSTLGKQVVDVRAFNFAGTRGPAVTLEVSQYTAPPSAGPSISVDVDPTAGSPAGSEHAFTITTTGTRLFRKVDTGPTPGTWTAVAGSSPFAYSVTKGTYDKVVSFKADTGVGTAESVVESRTIPASGTGGGGSTPPEFASINPSNDYPNGEIDVEWPGHTFPSGTTFRLYADPTSPPTTEVNSALNVSALSFSPTPTMDEFGFTSETVYVKVTADDGVQIIGQTIPVSHSYLST